MSEYTPTTAEVRDAYIEGVEHDCYYEGDVKATPDGIYEGERFDRWLAEVERAAAEKALAEAAVGGTRGNEETMIDLDALKTNAEAARRYAQHHGIKQWTEHIFAALALADAALARIARVEALHQRGTPGIGSDWCVSCEAKWPCATVRALTEGD